MRHVLFSSLSILALGLLTGPANAQRAPEQVVTPPKQVYWMDVKTNNGLAAMGASMQGGGGLGAAFGAMRNRGQSNASMLLQLGSRDGPSSGAPAASHTVPAGARIGPQLPLVTPKKSAPEQPEPSRDEDPTEKRFERPKGRLLLFFGCGERAKAGQPIVFDFARIAEGQMPPGLESRVRAASVARFNADNWRTYGEWPNDERRNGRAFLPAGASLSGPHLVKGNYTQDINFSLSPAHDVMAPVEFTSNLRNPSGSVALAWRAIPNATAYFAAAFGGGENEMVFWSSSEVSSFDSGASDYIQPSEAARLVRERVMMAPATTACTIPQEAAKAMAGGREGGGFLTFTAHGPEFNMIHPPRPSDPRTPWNQQYAVKARFQSATMDMLGQSMGAAMANAGARAGNQSVPAGQESPVPGMTKTEYCEMKASEARGQPSAGQTAGSAIGAATGIPGGAVLGRALGGLGKKKKEEPPVDPFCAAPAQ